jgi:hypothetical protein
MLCTNRKPKIEFLRLKPPGPHLLAGLFSQAKKKHIPMVNYHNKNMWLRPKIVSYERLISLGISTAY